MFMSIPRRRVRTTSAAWPIIAAGPKASARNWASTFHRLVTDQPLELALSDFLRSRRRRNKLIRRRMPAFPSS